MILIGQYDSPFVRRVGIALKLYDMAFEHRPWSVFGDADKIAPYNPLCRVPTLVLDSGDTLIESTMILDYLDAEAGDARALIPSGGPERRQALKVCALATGLADKAVALVYERVLHKEKSQAWLDRCTGQVERVLNALEADRAARATPYWFGDAIGHADIAVACALRFAREAHPEIFSATRWPTLIGHSDRCETLPVFKAIVQPFNPPR
ncbi:MULTISPECIES: glutathione S-transferase N-terminal domain-containing protein [Caballeronia]|uniref:Glutathione S-transferase n=1 Tax=Caballeronia zhejiangensis TaxID=871203 RepID=A0A656QLN8_9BURK|nr:MULTISPECIES: glutathione S-transferase N-terminal domain-containing protein [Caballeronia]EKS67085.1 glutathione S-transferase [Burkholderia sp. SJ98]KDR30368.1 glutathione S-transferase [Caballeronia zhejiangensis]MDR5789633.1 glutathione S-transferase N-terminal domain-containing protein [Caballeronia sp. LP003]